MHKQKKNIDRQIEHKNIDGVTSEMQILVEKKNLEFQKWV